MKAISLGALLAVSLTSLSGQAASPGEITTVRLRVFAHAAVDARNLELAKATARTLLASARIGMEWRNCGSVEDTCDERGEPVPVIVLLMPVSKLTREDVSAEVVRSGSAPATTVLVYLPNLVDRVRTVHQSAAGRSQPELAGLQLGDLVGLAIAHEVGHAFGLPHASSGVMKARLAPADLFALRASRLAFTSRDISALSRASAPRVH